MPFSLSFRAVSPYSSPAMQTPDAPLENARRAIDAIDAEMARLFERRMAACADVAAHKKARGLPVRDPARETQLFAAAPARLQDPALAPGYLRFLRSVVDLSCDYQARLLGALPDSIVLRRGAIADVGALCDLGRHVLVVTDDGVPAAYARAVADRCAVPVLHVIPAGEASKSAEQLANLHSALLKNGFTRGDCVVAVGGGVVGDLAGFAAATYMRGIDFYNVPTTLLAQVDSSIGGKTAIDFGGVKNVVGAFHAPRRVVIDPDVLDSLSPRQLRAGLAEAIKMAVTSDAALFELLERTDNLRAILPDVIGRALRVKAAVVAQDPYENGLRRVLNFGHTLGHAVEAAAGGDLLHGECIAIGMLPFSGPRVRDRLRAVLEKFGLPVRIPYAADALRPFLLHDKKAVGTAIATVRSDDIGTFRFVPATPDEILALLG